MHLHIGCRSVLIVDVIRTLEKFLNGDSCPFNLTVIGKIFAGRNGLTTDYGMVTWSEAERLYNILKKV